ncbi:MAG: Tetrathionate reductase subunit precursor [Verrucomicrobiota bacterium]|jgi:molybdopterin-containing oxidoreductase family iron-sulfur binding subunit
MSKRVFHHPSEEQASGRKYWRSLGQLSESPEFKGWLEREFPQGASELNENEVSRRNFVQLMGASVALAGMSLSACRRPLKQLVPFSKGLEWSVPGKALFFASSFPTRRGALPVLVTTHDGRPTKIEGNPEHPASQGATDVWAQSSLLDLYNPHRANQFKVAGAQSDREGFFKELENVVSKSGDGSGLAFVIDENHGPSRESLRSAVSKKLPKARWFSSEIFGESLAVEAASMAFGAGMISRPNLSLAEKILAVDFDFLGHEGTVQDAKGFAKRRKTLKSSDAMNRLYVVENRYTVTGGMADHRLRLRASGHASFLRSLAEEVQKATGDQSLREGIVASKIEALSGSEKWVSECAADLVQSKGKSLVLVGGQQSIGAQVLGHLINRALGAVGSTLTVAKNPVKPLESYAVFLASLQANALKGLVVLSGNPGYAKPGDISFADSVKGLDFFVILSASDDESSKLASAVAPKAHYLEEWNDGFAADGSVVIGQPSILPIFGGVSELEILAAIAGLKQTPHEVVKQSHQSAGGKDWVKNLRDGFYGKPFSSETVGAPTLSLPAPVKSTDGFEIVFVSDSKVDDGRYVSNGWLQELPDPITKLTWDNAALISPQSAKELSVGTGDWVELKSSSGRAVKVPVLVAPGHADKSVTVVIGYGRADSSPVGKGVGFDVFPIQTVSISRIVSGTVTKVSGKPHQLAITQEHGALEGRGADITRETSLENWKANSESHPDFIKKAGIDAHTPDNFSLYSNPPLDDVHGWGMAVDLSLCTGCSACMVACQAENNIPIVGKEQVIIGREMHWIRTDRYFAGDQHDTTEPEMVSQPMMCQHCENAPCETVCPVNATVHSEDGLNVMAYNRCIGTRYCANNCPFKVRRFNFFDYNQRPLDNLYKWNLINEKGMSDTLKMSKNPNVTVRMRGVMEKCTFCVQRIQEAKIAAKVMVKDSGKVPQVPVDSFTSACAQVCPTDAITFGDIKQKDSKLNQLKDSQRGYRLFEYLNTQNRVWYLARVKNPNPKMPDAAKNGAFMTQGH